MGASITAFLQIDDNTSEDEEPFTCHPSTWDLSHDIGFYGGKHYEFYAAICGIRNKSSKEPLFSFRGLPPSGCEMPERLKELAEDYNVSWLNLSELHAALAHMDVTIENLDKSVQLVIRAMAVAEELYGKNRVRIVFQCE